MWYNINASTTVLNWSNKELQKRCIIPQVPVQTCIGKIVRECTLSQDHMDCFAHKYMYMYAVYNDIFIHIYLKQGS